MPRSSLKNIKLKKALKFRLLRRFFQSSSDKKLSHSIHNIFGFTPSNIHLYKLAFLHKSAGQESVNGVKINNERLEFLGDAILDAIVADYLFKTFPLKDEGFLTEMRSKIVSRTQLNKLSQRLGFDLLVQLDANATGVFRSFKGDAFEAFIGALYLDRGYIFTRNLVIRRILNRYFNIDELVTQEMNYKSRIIEWAQKEKRKVRFDIVEEVGTGYKKQYVIELFVDDQPIERGQDFSIKGAEQIASERGWLKISGEQT
jgi:ribonuclease III